jgi:hypothetical protein
MSGVFVQYYIEKMNWDETHERSLQIDCSDKYSKRSAARDNPNKQVQLFLLRLARQQSRPGLRPLCLWGVVLQGAVMMQRRGRSREGWDTVQLVNRPMRNSAVRGSTTAAQNCTG